MHIIKRVCIDTRREAHQSVSRRVHVHDAGSVQRAEYERLQHHVYNHHGAGRAMRTADVCMRSCSHLILVSAADGKLIAGMRIHQRALGRLPVEAALPHSRKLRHVLDGLPHVVEFSGAVACLGARKTDLGAVLMRVGVAVLPLLGCYTAVGFGHQHVLPLYARFGMVPDPRLPRYGYPDHRYQSRVIVLKDALSLAGVHHVERGRIRALRRSLLYDTGASHGTLLLEGGERCRG